MQRRLDDKDLGQLSDTRGLGRLFKDKEGPEYYDDYNEKLFKQVPLELFFVKSHKLLPHFPILKFVQFIHKVLDEALLEKVWY